MGNTVAAAAARRHASPAPALYTAQGARKYLTRDERQRVLAVIGPEPTEAGLLLLMLSWTGARVSEVLALTPAAFQLDAGVVAIRTLKRRGPVIREMPVPAALMAALDRRFGLAAAQRGAAGNARLWPCCRATVWRHTKAVMEACGIAGRHACPRGMRHGFGVGTLQAGVPITLVQKWLGHTRLTTTAIYAEVSGPEERGFADGFYQWSGAACH